MAILIGIALAVVYGIIQYLWDRHLDKIGHHEAHIGSLFPHGCLVSVLEAILILLLLIWLI